MVAFTSYISSLSDPLCRAFLTQLSPRLGVDCYFLDGAWPTRLAQLSRHVPDVAWICGLLHVTNESADSRWPYEPIAAPVMRGARYGGLPVYFSDLIVRTDSPIHTLADIRDKRWAVNEQSSLSGYQMLNCSLEQDRYGRRFGGEVVLTGTHLRSIKAVLQRSADFATIDSTVWDAYAAQNPKQRRLLRVVTSLGPFPAPPIVVKKNAPLALRLAVQQALLDLHQTPQALSAMALLQTARFAPVTNADYDSIRALHADRNRQAFTMPMDE